MNYWSNHCLDVRKCVTYVGRSTQIKHAATITFTQVQLEIAQACRVALRGL